MSAFLMLCVIPCLEHTQNSFQLLDKGFSWDTYQAVWSLLGQPAGASPKTRPGVCPRARSALPTDLQLCPGEGAEVSTAAQVKEPRTLSQRQRVRRAVWLRLPGTWRLPLPLPSLWHAHHLQNNSQINDLLNRNNYTVFSTISNLFYLNIYL